MLWVGSDDEIDVPSAGGFPKLKSDKIADTVSRSKGISARLRFLPSWVTSVLRDVIVESEPSLESSPEETISKTSSKPERIDCLADFGAKPLGAGDP